MQDVYMGIYRGKLKCANGFCVCAEVFEACKVEDFSSSMSGDRDCLGRIDEKSKQQFLG